MTFLAPSPPNATSNLSQRNKSSPPFLENDTLMVQTSLMAFNLAHRTNAAFSAEDLIASGTWQKYEQRAASLARSHPRNDPFAQYLARLRVDGWPSRNSRQADRSALVRIAARDVLELVPIYWRQVLSGMTDTVARTALLDAMRAHLSPTVRAQMKQATRPLSKEERDHLERAMEFLVQVPPDPFHENVRRRDSRAKAQSTPTSHRGRDQSAKETLTALNRHARRKIDSDPDYDWRTHFWTSGVLRDRHIDDHRRACLAVLMLTGCRPAEFSEDLGIDVSLCPDAGTMALMITIAGAKTASDAGEGLQPKGQMSRTLRLRGKTPEALWLHGFLEGTG